MARERRVPRRPSKPPPPGKATTRHALRGPGSPKLRDRRKDPRPAPDPGHGDEDRYGDEEDAPGARRRRPIMVPTRWVKFVAGLLLLPACWVLSKTFFDEFTRVAVAHRFWATEEFYFFSLGALLWSIAFAGLPRPLIVYVFGHEATHALWVWLQLGEVSEFRVGREGGYIVADRRDFLVSLAPYFFPLYSIAVIAAFGAAGHYCPWLWDYPYRRWLFGAIGATWAFHATFTCWMIPKQQTDLLLHGTFFSLVIIYLANLCVLFVLLIVACPTMHWPACGGELLGNAADFSVLVREKALWLWRMARGGNDR